MEESVLALDTGLVERLARADGGVCGDQQRCGERVLPRLVGECGVHGGCVGGTGLAALFALAFNELGDQVMVVLLTVSCTASRWRRRARSDAFGSLGRLR